MNAKHLALAMLLLGLPACSNQFPPVIRIRPPEAPQWAPAAVPTPSKKEVAAESEPAEAGLASWYGIPYHGRKTASGEIFDRHAMTAAHPSLPLGTEVVVKNLATGAEVKLRVNDRFPGRPGYVIDVSQAAAAALGFEHAGRAKVAVLPVENG